MTFDDLCFNDFAKADGDDEDDEAPLYSAVVRFLTKECSRLPRDDFRYTKMCLRTLSYVICLAPPARRF